jgi:hypothetical protein
MKSDAYRFLFFSTPPEIRTNDLVENKQVFSMALRQAAVRDGALVGCFRNAIAA